VFEPEPDGGYTVHFPALRGCITYGQTLDEARDMAEKALELYLESLREDDLPIPKMPSANRSRSRSGSVETCMSVRLPEVRPRELERVVLRLGYKFARSRGSHRIYKHPSAPARRVVLSFHPGAI
jgi:predicted RNase H-like HicB family nuclease/predicted RNA binding protein YcfA (HicA-like mRNA interferase family)